MNENPMKLPSGESSVYERNRLVFNASPETENYEGAMDKAKRIASILGKITPRAIVSDVGCHTGVSTVKYGEVPGVAKMEGFDIADGALEVLQKRGLKGFHWAAGLEKCPVEDGRYDVVIASEIIEHVVDTDFFMAELKRIIKPKGHAIITTPNLYYWVSRIKFAFAEAPWSYPAVSSRYKHDRNILTEHIRVNGLKEWSGFFEHCGFEVKETKGLPWASLLTLKGRMIRMVDQIMPVNAACLLLFVLNKK